MGLLGQGKRLTGFTGPHYCINRLFPARGFRNSQNTLPNFLKQNIDLENFAKNHQNWFMMKVQKNYQNLLKRYSTLSRYICFNDKKKNVFLVAI